MSTQVGPRTTAVSQSLAAAPCCLRPSMFAGTLPRAQPLGTQVGRTDRDLGVSDVGQPVPAPARRDVRAQTLSDRSSVQTCREPGRTRRSICSCPCGINPIRRVDAAPRIRTSHRYRVLGHGWRQAVVAAGEVQLALWAGFCDAELPAEPGTSLSLATGITSRRNADSRRHSRDRRKSQWSGMWGSTFAVY